MRKPSPGLIDKKCPKCLISKTGICKLHLQIILERNKNLFLKCVNCDIRTCDFREKYDGVCIFEILDTTDWENKKMVNKEYHRMLNLEKLTVLRQARKYHDGGDRKDLELMDKTLSNYYKHIEQYINFKGWDGTDKIFMERKKEALMTMRKIFSPKKEIETEIETDEGVVENAIITTA